MWIHHETKKPLPLRRFLLSPVDQQFAVPEDLPTACIVSNGMYEKKQEWLLALERLASEKDTVTLEKKLMQLLKQDSPL